VTLSQLPNSVPTPAQPGGGGTAASGVLSQSMPLAPLGPTMMVSGLLVVILALYAMWAQSVPMQASRRRLRVATSMVMMLLLGALSFALTSVTPASPRTFLLAWSVVLLLVGLVLMLAVMDGFNTFRLYNAERALVTRQIAEQMARDARERREAARESDADKGSH